MSFLQRIEHSFRPYSTRILSKVRLNDIWDSASTSVELSPAMTREKPPAIFMPGELEKPFAVDHDASMEVNLERLRAGREEHAATIAYRVPNVLIHDGSVYAATRFDVYKKSPLHPFKAVPELQTLRSGLMCTHTYVEKYFAHWIIEGLPLEMLAKDMDVDPFVLVRKPWIHEAGYRDLLVMKEAIAIEAAHFAELLLLDDLAMNASKTDRFERLRAKTRDAVPKDGPRRVFIRRGKTGASRDLMNERDVLQVLEANGFSIVDPETMAAETIARMVANAQCVVGIEGSHLAHALLAQPRNSCLLTIQPPARFNAFYKPFTDAFGQRFALVVADAAEGGFVVSPQHLMATVELAEREMGA